VERSKGWVFFIWCKVTCQVKLHNIHICKEGIMVEVCSHVLFDVKWDIRVFILWLGKCGKGCTWAMLNSTIMVKVWGILWTLIRMAIVSGNSGILHPLWGMWILSQSGYRGWLHWLKYNNAALHNCHELWH
jgi:hypothetical protein